MGARSHQREESIGHGQDLSTTCRSSLLSVHGAGGYAKTISKKMMSETSKNSPNLALEEKYFNMQEQMEGVTSRLERAEHDLDYERAMRDDIIEAEVARRMAEAERRIRQSVEAEYADERAAIDKEKQAVEQQREDMQKSFELMTQQLQADVDAQIRKAKEEDLYKLLPEFWEDIN